MLFQLADVDVLQSILDVDIWPQVLNCSAIMCCVYQGIF